MANNLTRSAKTKVIHAGFLLADPDIQPKSEQSILIEGERIKTVSDGFIDPPPGAELVDLRKKFVLPGLIDCHVHLTAQLDQGYRLRTVEDSDPKVAFNAAHNAAVTLAAGFTTVRDVGARTPDVVFALRAAIAERKVAGPRISLRRRRSLADWRSWPDLRLSPRRLRLRAINIGDMRWG
jgi:imidazolonepropionase-like amidohydrolase